MTALSLTGLVETSHQWLQLVTALTLYATIVYGVVWLITRFVRTPALRYCLWSLVLLRLVLPPGLAHPLEARSWLSFCDAWHASQVAPASAGHELLATQLLGGSTPLAEVLAPWPLLLLLAWAVGVSLLSVAWMKRLFSYHRLARAARPVGDQWLLELVQTWREMLGIRRTVRLVVTPEPVSPFTVALLRPIVCLPESLLSSQHAVLEAVIAHELVHVSHGDNLWLGLQRLLGILYFFHPLVWLSSRQLSHERECVVDATVLSYQSLSPKTYATALLDVLQQQLPRAEAPALGLTTRSVVMRVRTIVSSTRRPKPRLALALAASLAIAVFLLPMAVAERADVPAPGQETANASSGLEQAQQEAARIGEPKLVNPVQGSRVSAPYGPMIDPFTHKERLHTGIDLASPAGTPVRAPAAGVVEVATSHWEKSDAAGTVIILDHGNGLKTFYSHLQTTAVAVGQQVQRGEVLGAVGSTGKSTGPHLHFEVWEDGTAVPPARYVPEWKSSPKQQG